ncbi:MAG: PQQ-binding-like beta-propeller repeat protein, partial [candidate division WOR-3 bacterium]
RDGTLKWRYLIGGGVDWSAAIAMDGIIFIGSGDGYLNAVQGSGVLANSPWPKFKHDNQNTGRVGGGVGGGKGRKFEGKVSTNN